MLPLPRTAVWLFLPGFVGSMILGMLHKIVPFLLWHYLLKTRTDKAQRLPTLTQMYHTGLAEAGYWLWTTGTLIAGLILAAGGPVTWTRLPLALSAASSLLFVATILQVLRAKPPSPP